MKRLILNIVFFVVAISVSAQLYETSSQQIGMTSKVMPSISQQDVTLNTNFYSTYSSPYFHTAARDIVRGTTTTGEGSVIYTHTHKLEKYHLTINHLWNRQKKTCL